MFKFDVAISYAGEEIGLAKDLYNMLKEKDIVVFFVEPPNASWWGKKLTSELCDIYSGPNTRYVIPLLSKNYKDKKYPMLEFSVAMEEEKKRGTEVVLPIIIDEVSFPGFDDDKCYVDLRKEGLISVVDLISDKLSLDARGVQEYIPQLWVATFGVNIFDLRENQGIPSAAPKEFPVLYDWFDKDLLERLSKSSYNKYRYLEDLRTGETFSIRVSFEWDPLFEKLDFGDLGWWELLEIKEYEAIYPESQ